MVDIYLQPDAANGTLCSSQCIRWELHPHDALFYGAPYHIHIKVLIYINGVPAMLRLAVMGNIDRLKLELQKLEKTLESVFSFGRGVF